MRLSVGEAIRALAARWWILLLAACLAAVAAYLLTRVVEARWRSSVWIQASARLDYGTGLATQQQLRPLSEQVKQRNIMREVDATLQTDLSPEQILERTKAEPVQDTSEIQIDVEDTNPARAEQLSLAIARAFAQDHNAQEQAKLREERVILAPLDRPNTATKVWPQTPIVVPAAALLGLLAAGAVVAVSAALDDSLRSPDEVREWLDLPVLAVVPRARRPRWGLPGLLAGRQQRLPGPPATSAPGSAVPATSGPSRS